MVGEVMRITLLNPGEMGTSVGAAAVSASVPVRWVSEGRGPDTRRRAQANGLTECATLADALDHSDAVISVCPPHAALAVAVSVAEQDFDGVFVDGNAVSPATMAEIGDVFQGTKVRLVDGGIIGPPAWKSGTTRLYLSGDGADAVAAVFPGSLLDARVVPGAVGAASTLKMVYAAWTKGSDALLLGVRAVAQANGVEDALLAEWNLSQVALIERSERAAAKNAFKAWRFEGEMHQIADTFRDAGMPEEFHRAAAEVYRRMAGYKDAESAPGIAEVAATIINGGKG